ncbi:hypothetical protein ACYZUD_03840 [Pseudomonas sp. XS1P51]
MPVSLFCSSRAVAMAVLLSSLLSGCSFNGNYPDAIEPDAAKLRFVSNTENATLDYFDGAHCEGQTTGLLNNLFSGDTQRRVGMSVAPPDNAKGYLEIKLKPEQDAYLHIQTLGSYSVCGNSLNLTPERGAEYEVTLDSARGYCTVLLQRLQRIDGKDVRTPMPIVHNGLPACAGRSPMFPKVAAALPDTPHRVTLIDQIIDSSVISAMKPDPAKDASSRMTPEKLDSLIAERKGKLGFTLPDDYWALYRQNLIAFDDEAAEGKTQTYKRYTDEYRLRLQRLDDQQLELWARPEDKSAKPNKAALEQYKSMTIYYFQTKKSVLLETINHHLDRMAQMDRQYKVCERYTECWKR